MFSSILLIRRITTTIIGFLSLENYCLPIGTKSLLFGMSLLWVCEQRMLWRDGADVQDSLSLRCSLIGSYIANCDRAMITDSVLSAN